MMGGFFGDGPFLGEDRVGWMNGIGFWGADGVDGGGGRSLVCNTCRELRVGMGRVTRGCFPPRANV